MQDANVTGHHLLCCEWKSNYEYFLIHEVTTTMDMQPLHNMYQYVFFYLKL